MSTLVLTELHHIRAKKKKEVADTLEEDVASIKEDFEMMQSLLMDLAGKRRSHATSSMSFSTWFRQLRDLAHNVEDCLQEFFLHLETPSRAAGSTNLLLPRENIAKQMTSLRSKIKRLNKSSVLYSNVVSYLNTAAVQSQGRMEPIYGSDSDTR
ncbi:hypothetical protein E2562_019607 [Oryza meyeriana var. granulata]|uniref:Disease resistance N-terminal domain-containing protein n=1 Tax=Oryza meyeriana var. granulata TaxID=110450 RepID=A0A6G1C794_9ORYZ|nr:hypothetical protein E2562_019607 [Oryza meyeriana var. granulata]